MHLIQQVVNFIKESLIIFGFNKKKINKKLHQ